MSRNLLIDDSQASPFHQALNRLWFEPLGRLIRFISHEHEPRTVEEFADPWLVPYKDQASSRNDNLRSNLDQFKLIAPEEATNDGDARLERRALSCSTEGDCFDDSGFSRCSGVGRADSISEDTFRCQDNTTVTRTRLDTLGRAECSTCDNNNSTCTSTCCDPFSSNDKYICACPLDRDGRQCGTIRPWRCGIQLISPDIANCTEAPCLNGNQVTNFMYNLTCAQDTVLAANVDDIGDGTPPLYSDGNFTYWTRLGNTFALSTNPSFRLSSRVFSFYRLSDTAQESFVTLNAEQARGRESVTLSKDLPVIVGSNVTLTYQGRTIRRPKYVTGGKLYVETGISSPRVGNSGFQARAVNAVYTSVDGWNATVYQEASPAYVEIAGADVGLIIVIALIGCLAVAITFVIARSTWKQGNKSKQA